MNTNIHLISGDLLDGTATPGTVIPLCDLETLAAHAVDTQQENLTDAFCVLLRDLGDIDLPHFDLADTIGLLSQTMIDAHTDKLPEPADEDEAEARTELDFFIAGYEATGFTEATVVTPETPTTDGSVRGRFGENGAMLEFATAR